MQGTFCQVFFEAYMTNIDRSFDMLIRGLTTYSFSEFKENDLNYQGS